ncbi:MAG: DNA starvation/stationary phase protection protein Dps [Candidatus Melainabacteria bacterium]|nr:DNA starvation/stationary phase protection protein Dps [Candidatus Melainabacteria bacterium]
MKTLTKDAKLYSSRIDLSEKTRQQSISTLAITLATTIDIAAQIKQCHWNVKAPNFIMLHELFDEMHAEMTGYVDSFAERITALGGLAHGSIREAAQASLAQDYAAETTTGSSLLEILADLYALLAKHLRQAIDTTAQAGDAGTSDLYTGISREIDKRLWFIESHLTK